MLITLQAYNYVLYWVARSTVALDLNDPRFELLVVTRGDENMCVGWFGLRYLLQIFDRIDCCCMSLGDQECRCDGISGGLRHYASRYTQRTVVAAGDDEAVEAQGIKRDGEHAFDAILVDGNGR